MEIFNLILIVPALRPLILICPSSSENWYDPAAWSSGQLQRALLGEESTTTLLTYRGHNQSFSIRAFVLKMELKDLRTGSMKILKFNFCWNVLIDIEDVKFDYKHLYLANSWKQTTDNRLFRNRFGTIDICRHVRMGGRCVGHGGTCPSPFVLKKGKIYRLAPSRFWSWLLAITYCQ